MAIHLLGIRHHGPGSAANVRAALEALQPDIVLVEGPPEADELLQWVTETGLNPPVALLCYQPDQPKQSVFYPFAEFSPEWQAIAYARQHRIPVRFMDLPAAHQLALDQPKETQTATPETTADPLPGLVAAGEAEAAAITFHQNPIAHLSQAAGFNDSETWWDHQFEHRRHNEAVFEAVGEAMLALRETVPPENRLEVLREAYMRNSIRRAEKEMFQQVAVVCGAWHVPALQQQVATKDDNALLKGLPKVKIDCTWVPWTYNRLSRASGYGAGIASPGWYHHLWEHPADDGTRWMAKVAQLFREKQMDTSVAHVIEAVRLAESLAVLRSLSRPGLQELNEATQSILCNGEPIMMHLVHDALVVSDRIGQVPDTIPKPPLQLDIEKLQKKLRLPATADWKDYTLDLRKENDLERSILLHRLLLLELRWGQKTYTAGKGTFKEQWRLQWDPSLSIDIIEKGSWGNTVAEAAYQFVLHQAGGATLTIICSLLQDSIPADLPQAAEQLIQQIANLSAASADVVQLMEVVPGLVSISRYGNVRNTDAAMVLGIVDSMVTRICISLPAACTAVDAEAAEHLLELFGKINDAVNLLQHSSISEQWQQTLGIISASSGAAPVIAGYSTRLLADVKLLVGEALVRAFYYAMSPANPPATAAAWLEGFLKGSGTLLLLDHDLWTVVDNWVAQLDETIFVQVLPLLRRTFANFTQPERRKLGEKAKSGVSKSTSAVASTDWDTTRARKGIPIVLELMGYPIEQPIQ
jgi:Family of unknown function (DUF5682)